MVNINGIELTREAVTVIVLSLMHTKEHLHVALTESERCGASLDTMPTLKNDIDNVDAALDIMMQIKGLTSQEVRCCI